MNRRTFLSLASLGGAIGAALLGWGIYHRANAHPQGDPEDWERPVIFVCCDEYGCYSSGVYMRVGGGRAAFDTVRQAAPFLRRRSVQRGRRPLRFSFQKCQLRWGHRRNACD